MNDQVVGQPMEPSRRAPFLVHPGQRPIFPGLDHQVRLDQAAPYLASYATLTARSAVAVQRAAHQFADALWWADADPRIAWIKLFGAVESAADAWDGQEHVDHVSQLTTRHPVLAGKLKKHAPNALAIVAEHIGSSIGAERKMREFIMAHLPAPPSARPAAGCLSYEPAHVRQALRVLYQHRSNELHRGIPFPPPLCGPPYTDDEGIAFETVPGLAMSAEGGYWPASSFPMHLHTFAHLVGGAIRAWWLSDGIASGL